MTETLKHYSAEQFREFLKCNKENFSSPSWSTDFKLIKIEGKEIRIHVNGDPTEEYDLKCEICPFDPSRIKINDSGEVDLSCMYFSAVDVIQLCKAVDKAPAGTKWIFDGSVFEKSEFRCKNGFNASFFGSFFKESIAFVGVTFDHADFRKATFTGEAYFSQSKFSGGANFLWSEFSGGANFLWSEFSGKADFSFSNISGKADFSHSTFASGVFFEDIKFKEVDFHDCTFSAPSTFTFEKACRISFCRSRFKAKCDIKGTVEYLTLRESRIDDIMRINVQGKTDREFTALDITDLVVLGSLYIDWKKHNLSKSIYDGHRISRERELAVVSKTKTDVTSDKQSSVLEKNSDVKACREISEQFQLLKEIYDRTGRYEDEDEALVQYMKARNKQRWKEIERSGFINGGKGILSWLGVNVMNVIGRFGVSPLRVFGWMLLIPILFAGFYTIAAPDEVATTFWNELTNSFISFMTLGLGLTDPLIWQQNYVIVEGFIGMFLIAYFTVSVARRTLR